jgi:hypothetical protein
MKAITSIYIPRIEKKINAEFIANVFDRNGIAKVSKVYIEPYKYIKNGLNNNYNRAYIAIKFWYDTEAAFNFLGRLRKPNREARLVYRDDNWWPIDINKYPTKLTGSKRVLTLFEEKELEFCGDDLSTTAIATDDIEDEFIAIDVEKTNILRNIIDNFKKQTNDNDLANNDVATFDEYLIQIDNEREKWFSEQNQYIYHSLGM